MKICPKCGVENSDKNKLCENCGNSLSNAKVNKTVEKKNTIVCPNCGNSNPGTTYICKFCNSQIPSSVRTSSSNDNEEEHYYSPRQKMTKLTMIIIGYIVYLALLAFMGEYIGGINCVISIIFGWIALSKADKYHFSFLVGMATWLANGGTSCGGFCFMLLLKIITSFCVGLFCWPIFAVVLFYDHIYDDMP